MFNIEGNSNYKVYVDDGYVVKKSLNKNLVKSIASPKKLIDAVNA